MSLEGGRGGEDGSRSGPRSADDPAQGSGPDRGSPLVNSTRPRPGGSKDGKMTSSSLPDFLALLLRCPLCLSPLTNPVTLLCGHTLCSRHLRHRHLLRLDPCPLPDCPHSAISAAAAAAASSKSPSDDPDIPNIPSSSTVTFIPAPRPDPTPGSSDPPDPLAHIDYPRTDVTVAKLASIIRSHVHSTSTDDHDDHDHEDANRESDLDDADGDGDPGAGPPPPLLSVSTTPLPPRSLSPSTASVHSTASSRRRSRRSSSDEEEDGGHRGGGGGDSDGTDPDLTPPRRQRPRKRRRHLHPPASSHVTPTSAPISKVADASTSDDDPDAALTKELTAELTCEICLLLFYRPLTTPCQHTFCAKCLQRSLDHSAQCPLCRHPLNGFAFHSAVNRLVLAVLTRCAAETYRERGRALEEEEHDARLDTPIFVCQLSFPGMPTLLHFFEPRYRLMLRRCLESPTPRFGMVMPPRPTAHGEGNDFGTMLEIRSVRMLPDGRSMVETWGTHRFRVMERGTLDGYMVGRVERIDDFPDELEPEEVSTARAVSSTSAGISTTSVLPSSTTSTTPSPPTIPPPHPPPEDLLSTCHAFLDQLRQGAAPWVVQRLNHTYGPMPSDASAFSFWMAMLLPIDEYEKAKLLPITSARLRLRLVVYWIEQLNSNWWFTSGCVIS